MLNFNIIVRAIITIVIFSIVTISVAGVVFFLSILFLNTIFLENGLTNMHMEGLSMLIGLVSGTLLSRMFWIQSGKNETKRTAYLMASCLIAMAVMGIMVVVWIFSLH